MKTTKKIVALVIAMMIISAMAVSAFAVTITITRDSSYHGASGAGNAYTWYRVFSATMEGSGTTTGGGSTSGTANGSPSGTTWSPDKPVAYTASAHVASKIGDNNEWFKLTKIAGSELYSVEWKGPQTSERVQAAAAFLIENGAWDDRGKMDDPSGTNTWTWTAKDLQPGYYVIEGATGKNLIAATSNIAIQEKNVYPPLDKTQNDETDKPSGTTGNGEVNVAIGDTITYEVKVTVPATAKVGDVITVWDKQSTGLTYNGDLKPDSVSGTTIVPESTSTGGEAWIRKITVKDTSILGKEIIFKFTMTVNNDALVDTGKKNEAGLKYGNESGTYYESIPDEVVFKTYLKGIEKYDGNDSGTKLPGVWFKLTDGSGTELKVEADGSGTGIYELRSGTGSGTGRVVTNASGTILIRGLDNEKKYQLVEISTLPGYNLLDKPVKLENLQEDTSGVVATYTGWTKVPNYKGTVLPSTGGMGTTILYIAGAILVLGAGILLVTKRRANY